MIAIITIEQKELLNNQFITDDLIFNPIQDADDNWVISTEEINQCVNDECMWVKDLVLSNYYPKINLNIFN